MGTPRHLLNRSLAAFLPCLLLTVAAVPAEAAAPAQAGVSTHASSSQARRFWTPARMRQARPLPPQPPGAPRPARSGRDGVSHMARSGRNGGAETPHRYPPRAALRGALASSTAETVSDPTVSGISQNGAIFVVEGNGRLDRCSGTSVNAPNFSLVITAGHCVFDEGRWLGRKWIFVPGYRFGQRPFGAFAAKWLGTTPQWLIGGNENFDVGAAVVSRNERGQLLADAVGADGIAWGLSPNQVFDIYGYPVAPPFDGATLQLCPQTPFEGHGFSSFFRPGPLNLAVRCNVTGGASGGGWVLAGGLLNGVTSNGYPDDPTTEFGPYFGKAVGRLFAMAGKVR